MPFDPNAYLAKKQQSSGFDPNAYLASKSKPDSGGDKGYDWTDAPRDFLQTNVDALPMYGMAAGGALGMGVASVPMAAGGAAAGESLKNTINSAWHGNDNFRAPTVEDSSNVATDTGKALMEGAAGEMGGQVIGKAAPMIAEYAGKQANEKAVKVLNSTDKFRKMMQNSPDKLQQLGQMLRDQGIVGMFSTPSNLAEKLATKSDAAGTEVGNIVRQVTKSGEAPKIDMREISQTLRENPDFQAMELTPGMEGTFVKANNALDTLSKNGQVEFKTALDRRRGIDKSIKEFRYQGENNMGDHLLDQRNAINNKLISTADDLANSGAVGFDPGALSAANKQYSQLATAEDLASAQAARDARNRGVSLTDTAAGLAGMVKGGPVLGAAYGVANKVGRTFGNGIQMSGYGGVQSAINSNAGKAVGEAANTSPYLLEALRNALSNKQP